MRFYLSVLIVCLISAAVPAFAQLTTGDIVIESENIPLDEAAITEAAQPLLDQGAVVVVLLMEEGAEQEARDFLTEQGLLQNGNYRDNLIGIAVSLSGEPGNRYAEIFYGEAWELALNRRAEGLISGELGPNLREQAYDLAFINTLAAIGDILATEAPTGADIEPTKRPAGGFVPPAQATVRPRPTYQPYNPDDYGYPTGDGGGSGLSGLLFCCFIPFIFMSRFFFFPFFGGGFGGGYSSSRPRYRSGWNSPNIGSRGSFGGSRGGGASRGGGFRGGGSTRGGW